VARSGSQNERICIALRGRMGGIGPSGATAGAADAAGAGVGAAEAAPPRLATALLQAGDKAGALTSRQRSAAFPPGFTPGQWMPKSDRQPARSALICCVVGLLAAAAAGGAGVTIGAAAGGGADAGCAAGGGAEVSVAGGFGPIASSADLQGADTRLALRIRQSKASLPPG
jgi:hypothetical protein